MSRISRAAAPAITRGQRTLLGTALLGAAGLILLGALAGGAGATSKAPPVTVVLGSTSETPPPSCPESPCQAVGSVTGFQISTDQSKLPFRVPGDGRVKAWTLTLAQPTNRQRAFFNGFFGMPPQARLAVLRKVPGTDPPRYNLRHQGSVRVLSPYLGRTVRFGASLRVRRGDVIGLTIPTWAPAFAQDLSARNAWRASRESDKCTNATDVRQGKAQQRLNTRATYACKYNTARLLYTATVVLD